MEVRPKQIARQLRASRVEDERPPHAERAAKQAGLEDDVVAWRRFAGLGGSRLVQSSWANTNAAKSTSCVSSTRRSSVGRPGLKSVVHGSTSATSSSPRVSAWISFACFPDDQGRSEACSFRKG